MSAISSLIVQLQILNSTICFQKLLCIHMAEFRVTIEAVWQTDGTFEEFSDNSGIRNTSDGDEEEMEDDDADDDDDAN